MERLPARTVPTVAPRRRRIARWPFVVLGLLVLPPALWIGLQMLYGPDDLLRDPLPDIARESVEPYAGEGCRPESRCADVSLHARGAPPIRFATALPAAASDERLPTVILFGGFRTGRESLKHLPELGQNAVVTYEYPVDRQAWKRASTVGRLTLGYDAAFRVPGQLAALLRWVRAQPWADPNRISLVGVSLGAMALPAAQRVAQAHDVPPAASIIAYGGADQATVIEANLRKVLPEALRPPVAWLLARLFRAMEPASHLPYLRGDFLLINGTEDWRMPPVAMERLQSVTPEPKRVVMLPSGHIDPKDRALLDKILGIMRDWLLERAAINP